MRLEIWASERLMLFTKLAYLQRTLMVPCRQAMEGNPHPTSHTVYTIEGSYVFSNIYTDFLKMCLFC